MCRYNSKGEGLLRCLTPLKLGQACNNHGVCRYRLDCSRNILSGKKCFNPNMSLKQGDSCNPNASSIGKQCVESSVAGHFGYELKCLKNSEGKFMCHRIIGLSEACKVDKYKSDACDDGLSCVRHGKHHVCVNKSRIRNHSRTILNPSLDDAVVARE